MINIIFSEYYDKEHILSRLHDNYTKGLKQGISDRHLLIVPDRIELTYQKETLGYLDIFGSFDIDVMSFSRFASKNIQDGTNIIDSQTEVMLIRKIVEENKSKLVYFKNASNYIGFAQEITLAINQIRNSGVGVESLKSIIPHLPTKVVGKTQDIITIYTQYINLIQSKYLDNASKLEALIDNIPNMELHNCHLYITEFLAMSQLELDALQGLITQCKSATICLLSSDNDNGHIYPHSLKKKVVDICNSSGHIVNKINLNNNLSPQMGAIGRNLFSYKKSDKIAPNDQVQLVRAINKKQEINHCVNQIKTLIKGGARYKDIAIICADTSSYYKDLSFKLTECNIPHYADIKTPLISQPISKFVLALLNCVVSNCRRVDFVDLAYNQLLGIDREHLRIFDNYCLEYGIEYSYFSKPFFLLKKGQEYELKIAEKVRDSVYRIVAQFDKSSKYIHNYCSSIIEIINMYNIGQRNDQFKDSLNANEKVKASVIKQSYDKVMEIITECQDIMGSQKIEVDAFANIITSSISSVEISTTPMYLDCVYVGDYAQSKYDQLEYAFIIGVDSGNFPMLYADNGIVAEKESTLWAQHGVIVEPKASQKNLIEKCTLLQILLKPKQKLFISCCSIDEKGSEMLINETMSSIADILDINIKNLPMPNPNYEMSDYLDMINSPTDALEVFLDMVHRHNASITRLSEKEFLFADALYDFCCEKMGETYINKLLEKDKVPTKIKNTYGLAWRDNCTSPSQLEKYFNCPFKHYVDYILKARRREKSGMEASDIGTFLHAMAEKFFGKPDWDTLEDNDIEPRCYEIFEELKNDVEDSFKLQVLLTQSNGDIIAKEMINRSIKMLKVLSKKTKKSKFRPQLLEVKFGFDDNFPAVILKNDDQEIKLRGIIDRVDMFGDRFIVIDYKSKSTIDFKPANIIMGERCQMFIYIDAIMLSRDVLPAGVAYMLMSDKMVKVDNKDDQFKYKGYVDANMDNYMDFDEQLASGELTKSDLFPIQISTTQKGSKCTGDIMNISTLANMRTYTHKLCEKAVGEIESGYIGANPIGFNDEFVTTPCRYCDYKNICNNSTNDSSKRAIPKVDMNKLEEIGGRVNVNN